MLRIRRRRIVFRRSILRPKGGVRSFLDSLADLCESRCIGKIWYQWKRHEQKIAQSSVGSIGSGMEYYIGLRPTARYGERRESNARSGIGAQVKRAYGAEPV